MKKFLFSFLLITFVFALVSCSKSEKEVDVITLYGTVIDGCTGAPIQNAQISVMKTYDTPEQQMEDMNNGGTPGIIVSAVTGSDGSYEFIISNLNRKFPHILYVSKSGYYSIEMDLSLSNVASGGRLKYDFLLYQSK